MFRQLITKYWTRLRKRRRSRHQRRLSFDSEAARLLQLEPLEVRRVLAGITVDVFNDVVDFVAPQQIAKKSGWFSRHIAMPSPGRSPWSRNRWAQRLEICSSSP